MEKNWSKPVLITIEGEDTPTTISNTTEASWALIEDWPVEDSAAISHALTIFTAVFEGKRSADDARKAFVEAAIEAGVHVKP